MRPIDADKIPWLNYPPHVEGFQTITKMAIDNMPTVDAEPVRHGKWIDEGQYADFFPHHTWRCSECGEHVIEIDTPWYRYCPSCGAKMDERREE